MLDNIVKKQWKKKPASLIVMIMQYSNNLGLKFFLQYNDIGNFKVISLKQGVFQNIEIVSSNFLTKIPRNFRYLLYFSHTKLLKVKMTLLIPFIIFFFFCIHILIASFFRN